MVLPISLLGVAEHACGGAHTSPQALDPWPGLDDQCEPCGWVGSQTSGCLQEEQALGTCLYRNDHLEVEIMGALEQRTCQPQGTPERWEAAWRPDTHLPPRV